MFKTRQSKQESPLAAVWLAGTLWPLYSVSAHAQRKKTVSPESTPRQPSISALGQICVIMRDGKVIYAGRLGWIGKFWSPAFCSSYLWPCPSSLCLNWSQSSMSALERSCQQILQENRRGSKRRHANGNGEVLASGHGRDTLKDATPTGAWHADKARAVRFFISHEQVVYVIHSAYMYKFTIFVFIAINLHIVCRTNIHIQIENHRKYWDILYITIQPKIPRFLVHIAHP